MAERYIYDRPQNTRVKCLCVLVVDVSGSMEQHMPAINQALQDFYQDILCERNGIPESTRKQLEIAVVQFDQEFKTLREPYLLNDGEVPPILSTRGSTTETVAALREAIDIVVSRKKFYERTGQRFYRPWIILLTDGEPYSEEISAEQTMKNVNVLAQEIKDMVAKKKFFILGLSVPGAEDEISESTLSKLTASNYRKLEGAKFREFFKWLSRSVGTLVKSRVEDGFTPDSDEFN